MPLREVVSNLVLSIASLPLGQQIAMRTPTMADVTIDVERRLPMVTGSVRTGIDMLEVGGFAPLVGRRAGLATDHSGLDMQGRRTIDVLSQAPDVRLNAIFAPEHGIGTDLDTCSGDTIDPRSNLIIYSPCGNSKAILRSALADLDTLMFDPQDAGVRFLTYLTILGATLKAAAKARIPVLVLDRPNPSGGDSVSGSVSDMVDRSLTSHVPLPLLYGMTIGELARLLNGGSHIDVALHVMAMEQYDRAMRFADTGLGWVPPSPNLRDLSVLERCPGVGLVEGTHVGVSRDMTAPSGMIGAPWMDGVALARELNALDTGVIYTPVHFAPAEGPYYGRSRSGVTIQRMSAPTRLGRTGLALIRVLSQRYPEQFKLETIRTFAGSGTVWAMLCDGIALDVIERAYAVQADVLPSQRAAYLLY